MKTCLLHLHHGAGLTPLPSTHRRTPPPPIQAKYPPTRTKGNNAEAAGRAPLPVPAARSTAAKKTVYDDNWFNSLAIEHLSSSIQTTVGMKNRKNKKGYEGLVEAAAVISTRHGTMEQQNIVTEALSKAFPQAILSVIRRIAVPSKISRQFFASFTTIFFAWLVGPCEVRDSDFNGKRETNVVYIRKCRFLEATNCVGMCTNLCKLPSQKFIHNQLGMPTTMVPNFEDQSCQIIFGQLPPADDPALSQPCYQTSCIAKQSHGVDCSC